MEKKTDLKSNYFKQHQNMNGPLNARENERDRERESERDRERVKVRQRMNAY